MKTLLPIIALSITTLSPILVFNKITEFVISEFFPTYTPWKRTQLFISPKTVHP